ncbi:MAG TPA: hypothetical protein VM532_01770 [Burkholderiales bacterium]|nr:hypothetical protein [Burkholderiales bacterium]
MPDINLTLKIAVAGGPTWSIAHTESVEAYDAIDVIIEPNTTDQEIEIQPGDPSQIAIFAIQSSLYGSEITFKVSDGTDDTPAIELLSPQLYGNGVAALFNVPLNMLKLSNSHPASDATKRARIQILVGRDPTP